MIKAVQRLEVVSVVFVVLAIAAMGSTAPVQAEEKLNYRDMVDEIGSFFNEALRLYKKGALKGVSHE